MKRFTTLLAILFAFIGNSQIQFSPTSNIEMTIANIFGVQCDGVSNVTGNVFGPWAGRFENGSSLGLNSGLMLSTGPINGANWPSSAFLSQQIGLPGDADLENPLYNGQSFFIQSFDAVYVQFDFTPTLSDTIRFNYVFASEEYPEYVGSTFTDRFLFLVKHDTLDYENIAKVPGDTIAVEINSINHTTNSSYFVMNLSGPTANNFAFDGYTVPLEAKFYAQAGVTYTIKLVLGDLGDGVFDSALLLGEQDSYNDVGGSLTVNGNPAEGIIDVFNVIDDTLLATPIISAPVTSGNYNIDSLETGVYHIRFTPDPIAHPGAAPLYFTDGDTWSTASPIGLPCFLDFANINSTTTPLLNGDGSISGVITIDTSYTKAVTEPFPNALVKLLDVSNETIAFAYTATDGSYSFSNLPAGIYTVLVDAPYIPQLDQHTIPVTGNEQITGADLEVLTDGIHALNNLNLGIVDEISLTTKVYPNPADDKVSIGVNKICDYTLVSLTGAVVLEGKLNPGLSELDLTKIEAGVYNLQIEGKNHRLIIR
jgi:hypothetical protein